jgi:hypothetical protein
MSISMKKEEEKKREIHIDRLGFTMHPIGERKPHILGMSQKLKAIMNIYISLHCKGPQAIGHPLLLSRHNLPLFFLLAFATNHTSYEFCPLRGGLHVFPSIYVLVM